MTWKISRIELSWMMSWDRHQYSYEWDVLRCFTCIEHIWMRRAKVFYLHRTHISRWTMTPQMQFISTFAAGHKDTTVNHTTILIHSVISTVCRSLDELIPVEGSWLTVVPELPVEYGLLSGWLPAVPELLPVEPRFWFESDTTNELSWVTVPSLLQPSRLPPINLWPSAHVWLHDEPESRNENNGQLSWLTGVQLGKADWYGVKSQALVCLTQVGKVPVGWPAVHVSIRGYCMRLPSAHDKLQLAPSGK